jgi:hypothetical protein
LVDRQCWSTSATFNPEKICRNKALLLRCVCVHNNFFCLYVPIMWQSKGMESRRNCNRRIFRGLVYNFLPCILWVNISHRLYRFRPCGLFLYLVAEMSLQIYLINQRILQVGVNNIDFDKLKIGQKIIYQNDIFKTLCSCTRHHVTLMRYDSFTSERQLYQVSILQIL